MKIKEAMQLLAGYDPEAELLVFEEVSGDEPQAVERIDPAMVDHGDPPGAAIIYLKWSGRGVPAC